ncbi:MAG TPA: protein-methionine-sulfoxide reductase heme-binding subunit MsrQ [Longimicrobiales bacterium]
MRRDSRTILLKAGVWAACLTPFGLLAYRAATGGLGANPIEFITHRTGFWCLTLLVVTLSITPVRRITGWNGLVRYRRLVGLFSFFYGLLHFLTYLVLDQFFDWSAIAADILKRPYITVGFTAFLILLLLALTSPRAAVRRLGRRWQTIHRLIYAAAGLAVLHFYWKRSAKNDIFDPLIFAALVAILLAARIPTWLKKRRSHPPISH